MPVYESRLQELQSKLLFYGICTIIWWSHTTLPSHESWNDTISSICQLYTMLPHRWTPTFARLLCPVLRMSQEEVSEVRAVWRYLPELDIFKLWICMNVCIGLPGKPTWSKSCSWLWVSSNSSVTTMCFQSYWESLHSYSLFE